MALESLPKIAPALFSAEQDLIQIYNKKSDTFGVINASLIGGNTPPSGVSGAIQFSDGSAFASDASNLFWDNVNKRLGIGTSSPTQSIETPNAIVFASANNDSKTTLKAFDAATGNIDFTNEFIISRQGTNLVKMFFNNNIGIGGIGSGAKLGIKGSGSTSATSSLLVQNSAGTTALQVFDDLVVRSDNSQLLFTNPSPTHRIGLFQFNSGTLSNFTVLNLSGTGGVSFQDPNIYFATNSILTLGNFIPGNNTRVGLSIGGNYTNAGAGGSSFGTCFNFNTSLNTSVGTITFNHISVTNSINTTGGTTLHRGFYYNPTITGTTGLTNYAIQTTSGGAYINTATPNASAALQADSTTQGFLPPRMSTAQKNAIATPAAGLVVFDTDLNKLCVRGASAWETITSV